MVGDSLIAVVLLLLDLAILFGGRLDSDDIPWIGSQAIALPVLVATVAPLPFRRKYPLSAAYAILLLGALHTALKLGFAGGFATCIAVYTLAMYTSRRRGLLYLGVSVAASITQLAVQYDSDWQLIASLSVLMLAFSWILGEFVGARHAYRAEVEARLHLLETERDQAARIAVAEERSRIARELHDVVAHAVSVIVVNADGGKYAVRANPDLAERALETISDTGRSALGELRRLLDVLRSPTDDDQPRVPQPGTDALAELAERMRTAGLPVDLDIAADLGEVPAGLSLGVYRIVQESLTNTLKHAGTGATARVRVSRDDDTINVEVHDDGAGKAPVLAEAVHNGPRARLPGGNGLIGMRERAHVYGGTLEAGPNSGGGWAVRAELPARLGE